MPEREREREREPEQLTRGSLFSDYIENLRVFKARAARADFRLFILYMHRECAREPAVLLYVERVSEKEREEEAHAAS